MGQLKITLKTTGFEPKSFETQAGDHTNWQHSITIGTKNYDATRREKRRSQMIKEKGSIKSTSSSTNIIMQSMP